MSDQFAGAWHVREYVYDADGSARGTVSQRRQLVPRRDGGFRVVQDCEPDSQLSEHPMAAFRGHHEFDLAPEGALRRYQGPDVIGTGVSYGDGAMLGRGVWPRFGYNFHSWSIMVAPDRQLTGGIFSRAGLPMAVIVGVGEPEEPGTTGPTLAGPHWPGTIAAQWRGTAHTFDASGRGGKTSELSRDYQGVGYRERGAAPWSLHYESTGESYLISGTAGTKMISGFARRYGWATYIDATSLDGRHMDGLEVVDATTGHVSGFRRTWEGASITRVDVLHLRPNEESHERE